MEQYGAATPRPLVPSVVEMLDQMIARSAGLERPAKKIPRAPLSRVYDNLYDTASAFGSSANSIIGSAFDAFDASSAPSEFFRANADYLRNNVSDARKALVAKQQKESALIPKGNYLDRATVAAKHALQDPGTFIGEAAGNVIPFMLAGPALAAAGVPTAASVYGLGAVLGAGAVKGGIYDSIMSADDKTLMSDSRYASMRSLGVSEAEAKKTLASKLQSWEESYGKTATGAGAGAIMGKLGADEAILSALVPRAASSAVGRAALESVAGRSVLGSVARGAAKEATTEGAQESLEQYLSNTGAAAGGANIDASEGVVESGVQAFLQSLIPGGAAEGRSQVENNQNLAYLKELDANKQKYNDTVRQVGRWKREELARRQEQEVSAPPVAEVLPESPVVEEAPIQSVQSQILEEPKQVVTEPVVSDIQKAPEEDGYDVIDTSQLDAPEPVAVQPVAPVAPARPTQPAGRTVQIPGTVHSISDISPVESVSNGIEAVAFNARMKGIAVEKALVAHGMDADLAKKESKRLLKTVSKDTIAKHRQALEAKRLEVIAANPDLAWDSLSPDSRNLMADKLIETGKLTPTTRNRSEIWRPDNPVTAKPADVLELVDDNKSMVPDEVQLELADPAALPEAPIKSSVIPPDETKIAAARAELKTARDNYSSILDRLDSAMSVDAEINSIKSEQGGWNPKRFARLEAARNRLANDIGLTAALERQSRAESELGKVDVNPYELVAPVKKIAKTVTLFRGTHPIRSGYSSAPFFSANRDVAEQYASGGGAVQEQEITFENLLTADTWQDVKVKLGLPLSASMPMMLDAARAAGHDGVTFTTTNGPEYVVLRSPSELEAPKASSVHPLDETGGENPPSEFTLLKMANYNGISETERNKRYYIVTTKPGYSDKILGTRFSVINPDADGTESVNEKLSRQAKLATAMSEVTDHIKRLSGSTGLSFAGLTPSGQVRGVSYSGKIYINPITLITNSGLSPKNLARDIVDIIIHELAHAVPDKDVHSPEIWGAEQKRIIDSISDDARKTLEKTIEKSLDMTALHAIAKEMAPEYQKAWEKARAAASAIIPEKKTLLSLFGKARNENTDKSGSNEANSASSGGNGTSGESVQGSVQSGRTGISGDRWQTQISRSAVGETEGMASGSDLATGDGDTERESDVIGNNAKQLGEFGWWQRFTASWINRYNRLGEVDKSLEVAAKMATPRAAEAIKNVRDVFVAPIEVILGSNKKKLADLDMYAYAMHAKKRNAEILRRSTIAKKPVMNGSGMTDQQADIIVASFKNDKAVHSAYKILMKMSEYQRLLYSDSGLFSEAAVKRMVEQLGENYVPLKSDEVYDGMIAGTVGGMAVKGTGVMMAEGRATLAFSPTSSLTEQLNRTIVKAEHNRVMNELAEHFFTNESPGWKIDKKGGSIEKKIEFFKNGEMHTIWIEDPVLLNQIKGMKPSELSGFVNSMREFTHFYGKLSTKWDPIFPLRNLIRDTPLGLSKVFIDDGADAAKTVFMNMKEAIKAAKEYKSNPNMPMDSVSRLHRRAKELFITGGMPSWSGMEDKLQIKARLEAGISANTPGGVHFAKKGFEQFSKTWTIINESVEAGIRISYFDYLMTKAENEAKSKLYELAKSAGNKEGMALYSDPNTRGPMSKKEIAAIADKVRGLTADFQQHGELSRYAGALYPFFNASVQGMYTVAKMMQKAAGGDKRAIKVFAMLAALGVAEDLLNGVMGDDDDDDGKSNYDDMPDWVRNTKFVIPAAGGASVMVPMTYGLSVAVNMGKIASRLNRGAMTLGDAGAQMASTFTDSFNPVGGGGSITQTVSPLATDWMVQVAENKDWRGENIYPDRFPGQEWKPNSEITSRRDSEASKAIAKGVNRLLGGDESTKANGTLGQITPYPGAIDAVMKWVGGGAGRFWSGLAGSAKSLVSGEPVDRIPAVSSFITSPDYQFYISRFNDQVKDLKTVKSKVADLKTRARRSALLEENPDSKEIETANAAELSAMMPFVESSPELLANFEKVGIKRLKALSMYESAQKKIKALSNGNDPDARLKIMEIAKNANRAYAELRNAR